MDENVVILPMQRRSLPWFFIAGISLLGLAACAHGPVAAGGPAAMATTTPVASSPAPAAAKPTETTTPAPLIVKVDFNQQVKPIFETYCYQCHGHGQQKGGVRLDVPANGMKHVIPGNPAGSDIYRAITRSYNASDHMPPVSQDQPEDSDIAVIQQWIMEGATWPDGS